MQIVLIGCSKKKHPYVHDPRRGGRVCPEELYAGPLFVKRVEYARRQCCPWFVLSAQFGLWGETEEKNPTFDGVLCRNDGKVYDLRITDLDPADRAAWITTVAHRVVEQLWEPYNEKIRIDALHPGELTVEIHAGSDYAHPLAEMACGALQEIETTEQQGYRDCLRYFGSGGASCECEHSPGVFLRAVNSLLRSAATPDEQQAMWLRMQCAPGPQIDSDYARGFWRAVREVYREAKREACGVPA